MQNAFFAKFVAICVSTSAILVCTSTSHMTTKQLIEKPISIKEVDIKQLKCLADNIYYEAGSETIDGKAAVARVVINRIHYGFASNPCNVVYQTTTVKKLDEDTLNEYHIRMCQFSWVCEKQRRVINENDPKYQKSKEVAYEVLANDAYADIVPKTALFFHNLTIDPLWPYHQVAKIGNHIFYSKQKVKKKENKESNNS
jgi:spore germination cell wall hydrolase CwlJ-like protein